MSDCILDEGHEPSQHRLDALRRLLWLPPEAVICPYCAGFHTRRLLNRQHPWIARYRLRELVPLLFGEALRSGYVTVAYADGHMYACGREELQCHERARMRWAEGGAA